MSHFTVLVINTKGEDDVEQQLEPFQESPNDDSPYLEFNDCTEDVLKEWEEKTVNEFYCSSSSSWGLSVSPEIYNVINELGIGEEKIITVLKSLDLGHYLELGKKYKCYPNTNTEYQEVKPWIEVTQVINTSHPDKNICFDGVVKIKRIEPPKEIPIKEYYNNDFEKYINDWHGYKTLEIEDESISTLSDYEEEKAKKKIYGYYSNPNAKWDWYQIGGRWAGSLLLRDGVEKEQDPNFSWGWKHDIEGKNKILSENRVDQARMKDIDWGGMVDNEQYEKSCRFWELYIENDDPQNEEEKEMIKNVWYKKEYYIKTYKNKFNYARCMSTFSTYAILKDGEWIGKGEMGWFGAGSESPEEQLEWEMNFVERFICDLPQEALLTVVDCHI